MKFSSSATAFMAAISFGMAAAQAPVTNTADLQQPANSPAAGVTLKTPTEIGCFADAGSMWDMGPYTYQTSGWCQPLCVRQAAQYFALVNGTNCFCGNSAPSSPKAPSSQCQTSCNGFEDDVCGGINHWAVWNTGYRSGDETGAIHITTPTQTFFGHKATGGPTTLQTVANGAVTVTAPASTASSGGGGGGPNKAAIAAGSVVGVVALAAIAGAAAWFIRMRKRREHDDERRRHESIMRIVGGGTAEKPQGFNGSDSRLEPSVMFQRRQSDGSIMDNQDYSRRILKVTNPDFRGSMAPSNY